ncbi:MAG: restriction endonuclease [Paraburkholderia sp.]|uniref:restriction endonuclease n=1 Tax=Paraburkholderia sp. TaxID=1926495 RepID=UPI003C5E3AE0
MGALNFGTGQLADHLHELVGYKAGVAVSLPELCDLLSGSAYPDLVLGSEEHMVRIRSEEYEDLYFTILHKVGHTPDKHNGIFDLFDLTLRLAQEHGDSFAETLQNLYSEGTRRLIEEAHRERKKSLDPTSLVMSAYEALGKPGVNAMIQMIETHERIRRLSPHSGARWVEWNNVIPLNGLFSRSSDKTVHGEFIDQRLIDFLSTNSELLSKMHWRKFEELVAEHFHRLGYKVELGPGQNDDGVDIRVWVPPRDESAVAQLHLIQCKRQKEKVDKVTVKGLYADVRYEGADLGVLVTTSSLSPGAKNTIDVRGYPIEEVNGAKVFDWLSALRTPGTGIIR